MLGGGTGWLLAELMAINPTCRVWYVEASAKMLALSRKRTSSPNVNFIYGTEESIPSGIKFDAVITHFYFDLFTEDFCQKLVIKIHPHIHHNGLWLIADFVNTTWWHGAMLGIMYRFFKVVSGVDVHQLPSWKQVVEKSGFKEVYSKNFFGEFIRSSLFRLK